VRLSKLNIIVCIKQVPEISQVKLDPVTHNLVREGVPSIVNPFDEIALEEALRIKEKHGGQVTVITMGPPQARDAILRCLAMGADKGVILTDRGFAGADTWATSYTLARAIEKLEYDLILCGKQAIDGDTAQVGPEIAEQLGIPIIPYVKKVIVDPAQKKVAAHSETDVGYDAIECKFPALLTAIKGLNEPRLPSVIGIMSAKRKEIKIWGLADIGGDAGTYGLKGSPTQVVRVATPEPRGKGTVINEEDPRIAAKRFVQMLTEAHVL
jgi:electron transfer flavoprotein alpha/beta subunit